MAHKKKHKISSLSNRYILIFGFLITLGLLALFIPQTQFIIASYSIIKKHAPFKNKIPLNDLNDTQQIANNEPDIQIIDGSIYKISQLGEKILLINKDDYRSDPKYSEIFYFNGLILSPDKTKMLLLAAGVISQNLLFYTSLDSLTTTFIDHCEIARWSPNSRYIAYNGSPGDAGAYSQFSVYDTLIEKKLSINTKPNIDNLNYDFLSFNDFTWLNDNSGILVNYTAISFDPDVLTTVYGTTVGKGEVIIPVNPNTN